MPLINNHVPVPNASVPNLTQSLSTPTPIPTVFPFVPQVASMFQVPSNTNTHPMVTRSKVGTFKPKALVAKASSDEPQSVVRSAKLSKSSSKGSKPDYTLTEPPSYNVAVQYPQWCVAMVEEFATLQRQGTWSLVPPSPSQNVVGYNWVFKLKLNIDGNINKHKARLVAKGFHQ